MGMGGWRWEWEGRKGGWMGREGRKGGWRWEWEGRKGG